MVTANRCGLALLALLSTASAAPPRTLELSDPSRGRAIPVVLYGAGAKPKPLALISHGYGGNNRAYSFIAEALAERGFVVASVQHELEGDAPMPTTGEPAVVRRPWWDRGAANLHFVIRELRSHGLADRRPVLLVGHSNGGDSSMLFAARHGDLVRAVFTLDNRRMKMPRIARPRICSVRSSDQPADPGVLPTALEQKRHRMVIGTVPVIHNDMWDGATAPQKQAILGWLWRCLAR